VIYYTHTAAGYTEIGSQREPRPIITEDMCTYPSPYPILKLEDMHARRGGSGSSHTYNCKPLIDISVHAYMFQRREKVLFCSHR
jgi:hypothetical protein